MSKRLSRVSYVTILLFLYSAASGYCGRSALIPPRELVKPVLDAGVRFEGRHWSASGYEGGAQGATRRVAPMHEN